jgi:penicillin G amidase
MLSAIASSNLMRKTPMPAPAPRKKSRTLRFALGTGIFLVAALMIGSATGAWALTSALHASYPQTAGVLQVAGLSAPVQVQRDKSGIPQIYAHTSADLFLAEGYVQAQDRFWQMDVDRHITSGTLASLVGAKAVQTDEFVRTLGWRQVAQASYDKSTPATRQYLAAYAKGVNDYLAARPGGSKLSIEYTLIDAPLLGTVSGYHPAAWTPVDTVSWLEAMAWDLRSGLNDEISRTLLAQSMSADQVNQLYPPYPYAQHAPIVTQDTPTGMAGATVGTPTGGTTTSGTTTGLSRAAKLGSTRPVALPGAARQQLSELSQLLNQMPDLLGPADPSGSGAGSNAWAVSGALTTTGKPLLANDPHLAPSLPSVWYQVGLHCVTLDAACGFDVSGYAFPGMPGVVIGHNGDIAWGLANEAADVSDLYLEKIQGSDYLYDGAEYPLSKRTETIDVAGGSPVSITVRATRHGPLISDVADLPDSADASTADQTSDVQAQVPSARSGGDLPAESVTPSVRYGVALQWTALQPNETMNALFEIDQASDWTQFRAAAADFTVPAQSLVYADTKGNIGYQAPGAIPIRKNGDGKWPVPGWTDKYDWTGYIPSSALPSEYNPAQGYIVTADNAIVGPDYPYTLSNDWDYGYRSQEMTADIAKLTANGRKLSNPDAASIQADTYNPEAALLVPYLLKVKTDAFTQPAVDLLKNWDYTQPASSGAAAYFNAVWSELLKSTFENRLPQGAAPSSLGPDGGGRWFAVVQSILGQPEGVWWRGARAQAGPEPARPASVRQIRPGQAQLGQTQPSRTQSVKSPTGQTRDTVLTDALEQARLDLTALMGKDVATWTWGRVHTLAPNDGTLGLSAPSAVQWLLNGPTEQLSGGSSLVDATSWDPASGDFSVTAAPSMRMIVDLANLDDSRWVGQTGESGHVDDPNYLDQAPLWAAGQTLSWAFSPGAVGIATTRTLTLNP